MSFRAIEEIWYWTELIRSELSFSPNSRSCQKEIMNISLISTPEEPQIAFLSKKKYQKNKQKQNKSLM